MGGGDNNQNLMNDVWSSPDGINWTCVVQQALWAPRYDFAVAVFDNKLWLMGGYNGSTELGDVWYTTNGNTWTNASQEAWHERYGHFAAGFDGALWIFGGEYTVGSGIGSYDVVLNEAQCSTDGINWTAGPLPGGSLAEPCGVLDDKLWFAGFYVNVTPVWCLSPVTVSISVGHRPLLHVGDPLTLTLAATGFLGATTYQWTKDGEAILNATTDTYHVDQAALSDAGSYTCQVTDENGVVFTADPVPVAVSAEKVPSASTVGMALGVALAASVLVLRKRKSPHPCG